MLINFFKNSKSFSLILITGFAVLLFIWIHFFENAVHLTVYTLFKETGVLISLLGTLFLTNHIARKNQPKIEGHLIALSLLLLLWFVPEVIAEERIMGSTVLAALGIRRLLGVRTQRAVIRKIFDSSIFLIFAIFIYPPAIPFFLLPFFVIFAYLHLDYRYFLIPFTAVATIWIVACCYTLFQGNYFFNPFSPTSPPSYSYAHLPAHQPVVWAIIFILILTTFCLFRQGLHLPSGPSPEKRWFFIQIVLTVLGLLTVTLALFYKTEFVPSLLFLFIPSGISIGSYFSLFPKKPIKEILFLIFFIGSIFFAFNSSYHFIS